MGHQVMTQTVMTTTTATAINEKQGADQMSISTSPISAAEPLISAPVFGVDDELPCQVQDSDLWFAERPSALEEAKALCGPCPVRLECLIAAIERREPWGCGAARSLTKERSLLVSAAGDGPAKAHPPRTSLDEQPNKQSYISGVSHLFARNR